MQVLWHALLVYASVCGLVWALRPSLMFAPDGAIKRYGSGPGQSPLPFGVFCGLAAVASYAYARKAAR